ncbi:MAG: putative sugar nucleotidyl transferase [Planctomycetota bacterium]|nr:putative sugar nucleotidyl transferase [Planctomycetota bacterium]
MRIAFFEDGCAENLAPIAWTRPVFELICGRWSLRERCVHVMRRIGDDIIREWGALVRPYLADVYREAHLDARVNDAVWLQQHDTLLINGRWLPSARTIETLQLQHEVAYMIDNTVVAMWIDSTEAALISGQNADQTISQIAATRTLESADGVLIQRPWDLVNHNGEQLMDDAILAPATRTLQTNLDQRVAILGTASDVSIDPRAEIDPFVVIDARHGPVSVDAGAAIQAFTRLEGPCHVGRGSQLFRANVRGGTTIGNVCRVGGEIECSILHSHANKYHDGFLGHSYVCPWVNLGAMTTNSDLKNDYSAVRVPLSGEAIETGQTKVGCFIGDHTKTALSSLFNTGSSIGVMSIVLPGGELLPKHVPSFSRIWHGELIDGWDLDRSLELARVAQGRRDQEFTVAQETLLRFLHQHTRDERMAAIERFHGIRSVRPPKGQTLRVEPQLSAEVPLHSS